VNKRQWIVVVGVSAYALGGLIVGSMNIETIVPAFRYRIDLFIPVFKTVGLLLAGGGTLIWLLRDRNK
jgi:hypothetical protein